MKWNETKWMRILNRMISFFDCAFALVSLFIYVKFKIMNFKISERTRNSIIAAYASTN